MTEVANLNIKADATSVDAAKVALRDFNAEAKNTGAATRESVSAMAQMADKIKEVESAYRSEYQAQRQSATAANEAAKANQSATSATQANASAVRMSTEEYRKLTGATKEQTAATQSATKAQAEITAAIAAGRAVTADQIKAVGGLSNAMKIMEGAHLNGAKAVGVAEKAAKSATTSFAGLHIQTSTFVRELLVLGREAGRGDFTRMAGSATILAQSMGLLEVAATGVGLAVIAVGVAIGAAIGIVAAGEKEFYGLQNSLLVTGNYAGITADQFDVMAKRIASSQDVGIRSVKNAMAELVGSGKFTADTIDLMVQNAEWFARVTGQKAEEIVKNYETMKGGVVKWAVKHEEVYHDLTLAQIDYIDKLEKAGKHHEAELQLMEDIHNKIKDRVIPQFGTLQTMLHNVAVTASSMWDKILGIGRPKGLGEQLEAAEARLASMETPYNKQFRSSPAYASSYGREAAIKGYEAAKADVARLTAQMQAERTKAAADAKVAQEEDDKIRRKYDNQGFHANRHPRVQVDKVGEKQEAIQAEIDGNRGLADAYDLSTAAGFRASAMKKALADAAVTNGKAAQFEQLEITNAVTKALADGTKQTATLEQKTRATRDANVMMEATGVSQGIANQAVQDALVIAGLQAAADNATGQDKTKLLDLIIRTQAAQRDANATARDAWMIQQETSLRDSNEELSVELEMINSTNRERAVRLAQLRAEKELRKSGVDPTSARGTAYIQGQKDNANKRENLASGVGDAIKQGKFYLQLQDEMVDRTKDAASSMAGSFGLVGEAISNLTTVFADHYGAVERMDLDYAERRKEANGDQSKLVALQKAQTSEKRDADLKYYGDVAGAAASFFGKQTIAYKVLHATEMGFRAFQLVASIQAMVQNTVETGHTVATNAVKTASNVAAGGSKMFSQLGIYAFPLIAAMLAVMAGLGASGGGGAAGAGGVVRSEDRQKTQGTGSVLGDNSAQSSSIQNSMKIASNNSVKYLETSNRMLDVLKSIDSKIGVLAAAIARTMQVSGGMFDTGGLNLGTNGSKGFLGVGGKSTTRSLSDLGIEFGSQTLGDILANGVSGRSYQEVMKTTTKNGVFGIGGGTKTSYNTTYGSIDDDVQSAIQDTLRALRDGIVEGAKVLGITGADEILKSFTLSIGSVSFANMSGAEIEEALNAIFSKAGDDMANAVVPGLKTMQKVGEGLMETLVRVAREYQVVDLELASIGKTFRAVGQESVFMRDRLVQLFGGLDGFTSATDFFVENFLSEAEQLAPVANVVHMEMGRLGLSAVTTKEQFKTLVMGLDLSTTGGQDLYAALMKVAPAFDKVTTSAEDTAKAARDLAQERVNDAKDILDDKQDQMIGVYRTQSEGIQAVIDKFRKFSDTLRSFKQELTMGGAAGLSPQDQYFKSRDLFQTTAAKARGGDSVAIGQLQTVGQNFLEASRSYFASSQGYFDDLSSVQGAVDQVLKFTDNQVEQGDKLQKSLDDLVNSFAETNGLLFRVQEGVVSMDGTFKLSAEQITNAVFTQDGHLVDIRTAMVDADGHIVTSVNTAAITIGGAVQGAMAAVQGAVGEMAGALAGYQTAVNAQNDLLRQQKVDADNAALAAQQIATVTNNANNTPTTPTTPTTTPTATGYGSVWAEIQAERPDVVAAANNLLATADRNSPWFSQHGLDQGAEGFANWWLANKPSQDTWSPDGFAVGGDFQVGGAGGSDSKRISFRATPGEMVSVRTPGTAGKDDPETKQLLGDIRELLQGVNMQLAEGGQEQVKQLQKVAEKLDATKRAVRNSA